jgi:hypothetical protein
MSVETCHHCGSTEGTWLDRSYVTTEDGVKMKWEEFATRCNNCGKNVDAPKYYYGETEQVISVEDVFSETTQELVKHCEDNDNKISEVAVLTMCVHMEELTSNLAFVQKKLAIDESAWEVANNAYKILTKERDDLYDEIERLTKELQKYIGKGGC